MGYASGVKSIITGDDGAIAPPELRLSALINQHSR